MFNILKWFRKPPSRPKPRYGWELTTKYLTENLSREELLDVIDELQKEIFHASKSPNEWFDLYLIAKQDNKRMRSLLESEYHNDKAFRHAQHVADLESKCKQQGKRIQQMQDDYARHNNKNYATGLIVKCTGCDAGQPFDGENLTEERVAEVERIAKRLRTWFEGHKRRIG